MLASGHAVVGQSFEVASIRLNTLPRPPQGPIDASMESEILRAMIRGQNGRFRSTGSTVQSLIQAAYEVRKDDIEGGPSWVRADRYVIEARGPADATGEAMRASLRALLADRFGLTLRRETRRQPVYELVVADGGPKVTPMKDGDCITDAKGPIGMSLDKPVFFCGGLRRMIFRLPPDRADRVEAGAMTMARLTEIVGEDVGRRVIDKTGITAPFNLLLDFAPMSSVTPGSASSTPTIFTALQEQLGLRLQSSMGPVDVLVIERVERPSEN